MPHQRRVHRFERLRSTPVPQTLEQIFEEVPAVNWSAEISHIGGENFVEIFEKLSPAHAELRHRPFSSSDLRPELGFKTAPEVINIARSGNQKVTLLALRGRPKLVP